MHALFTDVLQFSPLNMLFTLGLMLFRSVSAGASLLLILPLLQVIGFSVGSNQTHGVAKTMTTVFHYLFFQALFRYGQKETFAHIYLKSQHNIGALLPPVSG